MSIVLEVNGYHYDVDIMKFHGGEVNVNILKKNKGLRHTAVADIKLHVDLKSSDDVMTLLLVKDAVDTFFLGKQYKIELHMPYLPYARQDRVMVRGEAHSIRVMCKLINDMSFDLVRVADCHSDVSTALLNKCVMKSQEQIISKSKELSNKLRSGNYVVVSPDAGAEKKALEVAQTFGCDMIRATKTRDVATGKIKQVGIVDTVFDRNKNFLIVDDIGDGMGTFLPLSEELRSESNQVDIYVTHGIFSKGLQVVLDKFDTVYTTNSYFEGCSTERVKVIEL